MGKIGRPSKFSPVLAAEVVRLMRDGASRADACLAVGINRETLRRWRKEGESRPKSDRGAFAASLRQAAVAAKVEAIACLLHAARKGEWKAAAWYLERQFPSEWGRINRVEVATSGPVSIKWPAFEVVPMPGPEPRQDPEFEWVEDGQPEAEAKA